jgi:hypothetical protein
MNQALPTKTLTALGLASFIQEPVIHHQNFGER